MSGKVFGGTGNIGHLFEYDPATQKSTDLGEAVTGQTAIYSLLVAPDGYVYGGSGAYNENGHLFRFDPTDPSAVADLGIPIAGANEIGSLTWGATGWVYGATNDQNSIFSYNPATGLFQPLGTVPYVSEVDALVMGPDGKLYGGGYPSGSMFVFDPNSGQGQSLGTPVPGEYTIEEVVVGPDGKIYGGTRLSKGHLFRYDIGGGAFEVYGAPVWQDTNVYSLVVGSDGQLYGGTGYMRGRLFRFDPLVHPFVPSGTASSISIAPRMQHQTFVPATSDVFALAVAADGRVYASGYSTSYAALLARWDPETGGLMENLGQVPGAPTVIYSLLEGPDGKIYGGGGSYSVSANFFSFDPASGQFGPYLYPPTPDENYVYALTLCTDGKIYGGTGGSGSGLHGQVFAYAPATGTFEPLGQAIPAETAVRSLVCAPDGTLYGGTGSTAHLFKLTPLWGFTDLGQPLEGETELSALTWGPDGLLYGGTTGSGRFFAYHPSTGQVTDLGQPYPGDTEVRGLATGADGLVYGVTGYVQGHLFAYDPSSGILSDLGRVLPRERYADSLALAGDAHEIYLGTGYIYGELVVYAREYGFAWLDVSYAADVPPDTGLQVDVLDSAGSLLLEDVPSGANLAEISPTAAPAIQLRATLTTTDPGVSPALLEWQVTWTEDPRLEVDPPALAFEGPLGGPDPVPQGLVVSNSSGGELPWSLTDLPGWLAASPLSGIAPSTLVVTASVDGLQAGFYTATLVLDGPPDCVNCPVDLPVSLTVHGQPVLSLAPHALSVSAVEGETEPATAEVTVDNVGTGVLTWTATVSAPWLAVSPAAGVAPPAAITLATADPTGLSAGTYTAVITFAATGACANCPLGLPVTFSIEPAPAIQVAPAAVAVTSTLDGPSPRPVLLSVSNGGGGELVWQASVDMPWLWAEPVSGTVGTPLWLHIDAAGLEAGTHNGALTLSDAGGLAEPVAVPVQLHLIRGPSRVYLPLVRR